MVFLCVFLALSLISEAFADEQASSILVAGDGTQTDATVLGSDQKDKPAANENAAKAQVNAKETGSQQLKPDRPSTDHNSQAPSQHHKDTSQHHRMYYQEHLYINMSGVINKVSWDDGN